MNPTSAKIPPRPSSPDAPPPFAARPAPWVAALDMGYGHLRPAASLAAALGTTVRRSDHAPLADARDRAALGRMHALHVLLSRAPVWPIVGPAMSRLFDLATWIPRPRGPNQLTAPNRAARFLQANIDDGFGSAFVAHLRRDAVPLITTYFAQAVAADLAGIENVWCVVTDSDVNRVWVPMDPSQSRIRYCVASHRTGRLLRSYGVASERIHVTGFPLPPSLLGGPDLPILKRNLAARFRRLDPQGAFRRDVPDEARATWDLAPPDGPILPPHITFAVGGAGAQTGLARELLHALQEPLARGAIRLTLVAGIRRATAASLESSVARFAAGAARAGTVRVLYDPTFDGYFTRFDACLAETDLLWTKPSEMIFYGALGIPLALAPPLGFHERRNGALARRRGFGLEVPDIRDAWRWLESGLASGDLARAAWRGFSRMPKHGTYRIADLVRGAGSLG